MAHEVTIRDNGFAEVAYAGQAPWYRLGQPVSPNSSIEVWRQQSGLNWDVLRAPANYLAGTMLQWNDQHILYRSDTKAPLGFVSKRFKIVQPAEILEFFRDLVEQDGFTIETAGSLQGGKRIWALARTGLDGEVVTKDKVKTYLLLVTGCDRGLSTTAEYTSVRVVCMNTMRMALERSENFAGRVRVPHSTTFDPEAVKGKMGLDAKKVYTKFMDKMRSFANLSLSDKMAEEVVASLFKSRTTVDDVRTTRGFRSVMQLFNGAGKGSQMDGVRGTGWGLLNAVTEYTDFHIRSASQDNRLTNAWFGENAKLKEDVVSLLAMV